MRDIETDSTEWTEEEIEIARQVMEKFANCMKQKKLVPPPVFEANLEGNKSVNSDVAVIERYTGKIYLPQRGREEAFTGKIHLPGTTHRYETLEQATKRLLDTELVKFNLRLAEIEWLTVLDLQDLPRAPVQSNLYLVLVFQPPFGLEKDFYQKSEIPFEKLVTSHREVTLPWLIDHQYI